MAIVAKRLNQAMHGNNYAIVVQKTHEASNNVFSETYY